MGLFSDIQDEARCEARQTRMQAEQPEIEENSCSCVSQLHDEKQ